MSRHRNIRSMNYADEYDGYDNVYGHYCISPSDAALIYDRDGSRGQQKISSYLKSDEDTEEEDETDITTLDDVDKAKLESSIDEIRSLLGELKITDTELNSLILKNDFETEKIINVILNVSRPTKPERTELPKAKDSINNTLINQDQNTLASLMSGSRTNKFNIPKLFANPQNSLNSLPRKQFEIPKLFSNNSPDNNKTTNDSASHDSLASLISSYLGTTTETKVPKLFDQTSSNPKHTTVTLNSDVANWDIDLTHAIRDTYKPEPKLSKPKPKQDEFMPKYFDFEQISSDKKEILPCRLDLSALECLDNKLEKNVSDFGKTITHHFVFQRPIVEHPGLNCVKPKFKFDTPSPDDQVLKRLRRK